MEAAPFEKPWLLRAVAVTSVLVTLAVVAVGSRPSSEGRTGASGEQGIYGRVILYEGDCMPSQEPSRCNISFPARVITVREPLATSRMDGAYVTYPTFLIAQTVSGADGTYRVALPPGTYSVFVEDGGREYCWWSDNTHACPVTVADGFVLFDLTIDHASW